jgi:hypothetical protein
LLRKAYMIFADTTKSRSHNTVVVMTAGPRIRLRVGASGPA